MQRLFSHKTEKPTIEPLTPKSPKRLAGKVVLIVGGLYADGAGPGGRTLIADLAAQGADVALVYALNALDQAQAAQRVVQAQGQRCLLVPAHPCLTPQEIVQQILAKLGSLDVFLDFTADKTAYPRPLAMPPIDKLAMLVAAMQQLAPDKSTDLEKELTNE